MAFNAGAVVGTARLDTKDWVKGTNEIQKSNQKTQKGLGKFGKLLGGVGAGIAAGLTASVMAANDFEKSFSNVATLVDPTVTDLNAMKSELLGLDSRLGSAKELTEGLYQALSASVEPGQAVEFVGEAAKFAKAALIDTNSAVDVITTGLNAYGLGASEAGRISDVLFNTIKSGKVTGQELGATIGQVIPLAANMNLSFENLGASIATMTKQGVNSAEATTQLNAVMTALLKPSGDLSEAMKSAGFETGEAVTSSDNFQAALQQIIAQTDGSQEALAELFPNVRALRGALALTGEGAQGFTEDLESMTNSSGATQEAFEAQRLTFETLLNSVNKFAIRIGQFLLPIIDSVVNALTELFDGLTGNNEVMGALGEALTKILGTFVKVAKIVINLAVRIGGILSPLIETLVTVFTDLFETITTNNPFLEKLAEIIGIVSGAIEIIVGWVTELLGLVGDTWKKEFEKTVNSLDETQDAGNDMLPVFRVLAIVFGTVSAVLNALIKIIGLVVRGLINLAKTAGAVGGVIGEIIKLITFRGSKEEVAAAFNEVKDKFDGFITDIKDSAVDLGKEFIDDITNTFAGAEEKALEMQENFNKASKEGADAFKTDWNSAGESVKKTFEQDVKIGVDTSGIDELIEKTGDLTDATTQGQQTIRQEIIRSEAYYQRLENHLNHMRQSAIDFEEQASSSFANTRLIIHEFTLELIEGFQQLGESIQDNVVNGLQQIGEALATGADAFDAFKQIVINVINELTSMLALQFLSAGLQLIISGNIPLGLAFIALAGVTAFAGGFVAGLLTGKSEEELETAASGGIKSGLTLVGEEGPELVNLGSPSRVVPADETRGMMGGMVVNVNFSGPINNDVDLDKAGIIIGRRVQAQARSLAV